MPYTYALVMAMLLYVALVLSSPPSPNPPASRLLAHVFDPELDKPNPREYVVYICPLGALGQQMEEFMDASINRCGRNGAHKSISHVTLCQFFKVGQRQGVRVGQREVVRG